MLCLRRKGRGRRCLREEGELHWRRGEKLKACIVAGLRDRVEAGSVKSAGGFALHNMSAELKSARPSV